jgi:hypothetical protein
VFQVASFFFILDFIPEVVPMGFNSIIAVVHLGHHGCQHLPLSP